MTLIWAVGLALSVVEMDILTLRTFDPAFRTVWLPLLFGALFVIARRRQLLAALWPYLNRGMLAVFFWAIASIAWSSHTLHSFTQVIGILVPTFLAIAFAVAAWNGSRFESVMSNTIMIILVMSVLWAIAFPSLAIHQDDNFELAGAWRGITYQKNGLGQVAAIGVIISFYQLLNGAGARAWSLARVLLSLFVVYKSRSNTSLMLAVLSCALMLPILKPQISIGWLGRRLFYGSLLIVIPLSAYLATRTTVFGFVGSLLGKSSSFTGRTPIWNEMFMQISKHPFLGTGFSAFWQFPESGVAELREQLQWNVPTAHNGYIELTNELGLIGLGLFLIFLALHAKALAQLSRLDPKAFALHAPLLVYLSLANFSESGWMYPIAITHLVVMYSSIELSRRLFACKLMETYNSAAQGPAPPQFSKEART